MELRLRRTRAGAAGKPCEFLAHEILALLLGHLRHAIALDALQNVCRIPALERIDRAVMHFPHGIGDLVEKPTVVSHREQRARSLGPAPVQIRCQPGDGVHVQMVRRLVEHQNVPVTDQKTRQVDAAALAA